MNANETLTVGQGQSCRIIVVSSDGPETLAGPGGEWRIVACRDFSMHLVLERDASAEILALMFPGADSSMDFNVELDGPGADCRLSGIYLCPGSEKARVNVLMSHKSGHCSSGQKFKGIVSGTARAAFTGKIVVARDAQKTESFQENHSLLLSDGAKVDTMPQLEIYADDVKCSHGATVGKLNAEEQFYMRSRGIPEKEAMVLQMLSFLSSVLEILPEGELRERIAMQIEHTVRKAF